MLLNELRQSLPVVEVGRHARLMDGAAAVLVDNLSVDEVLRGESDLQVFLRRRADRELQGHQRVKEIVPMEPASRVAEAEAEARTLRRQRMEWRRAVRSFTLLLAKLNL